MVVLIPKGCEEYLGIGIVEVLWKVVTVFLNRHFISSIAFHDFLHGFQSGCSTVAASLNSKMLQQLTAMREEVVYAIFLDLNKAYDALYSYR